jgi:hypothetical protein
MMHDISRRLTGERLYLADIARTLEQFRDLREDSSFGFILTRSAGPAEPADELAVVSLD